MTKQKKLYMCFVGLEKTFDRGVRKVGKRTIRKKGSSEALIRAVKSQYKGTKTKVNVATHLSEEFEMNVGVHHGSALSQLLFPIVNDIVANEVKEGM